MARTYLVPAQATIAQLGPDPLLLPLDRTESRLLQVLTALLQPKLGDSVQAQAVLREAVRQLRMLSPKEREQTLKLLESQVHAMNGWRNRPACLAAVLLLAAAPLPAQQPQTFRLDTGLTAAAGKP